MIIFVEKVLEKEDLLRIVFPEWLFDYFDFVKVDSTAERLDVYLDEKKLIPSEYRNAPISSHGFTSIYTVQDFPLRGKEVYLHLRRRKWLLLNTRQIVSLQYDFAFEGTRLTKEFVAFLKATN
uniref:ISAon1 family transposase N-terminal region protein n=1 Tax=uncultured Dysgonomonas sp. TaxID=206096 RepID=UPI0026243131|nr:transposase family protein [uncultured Dysgonomonas sp.]